MNYDREQILPGYGYRVNKVKYNLQIEVDKPSIRIPVCGNWTKYHVHVVGNIGDLTCVIAARVYTIYY